MVAAIRPKGIQRCRRAWDNTREWDVRSLKVVDSLVGKFIVPVQVNVPGSSSWWLTGVYGPNKASGRLIGETHLR
ncbi:hypothetical protein PanWU01x14_208180 [Parasponia andersonii]|uniref:Uncharacterized protein n=1 Tax=Parasponia andersonii TaxID=3476 RepID=A0A2P5BUW3_PARAD|nr:hypothetical protein PanWU01x14_208180 [Parasponia andersonii]